MAMAVGLHCELPVKGMDVKFCPSLWDVDKCRIHCGHYSDVMTSAMSSPITGVSFVHSTVYSGADQGKQQNSASLTCVKGIHR